MSLITAPPARRRHQRFIAAALALCALTVPAGADPLLDGEGHFVPDLAVWSSFGQTLNNFIGAEGNALPVGPVSGADLLDVPAPPGFDPSTDLVHVVNDPSNVYGNPTRRTANPTNFTYDASDPATLLATASGEISLAGVARWTVAPQLGGGQLLFGDYNLRYNRNLPQPQWELINHIDFPVVAFSLGSPLVTTGAGGAFSVSGDLIGSASLNILFPGALGRDFGDFTFAVPEPTATAQLTAGLAALVGLAKHRHRKRAAQRASALRIHRA